MRDSLHNSAIPGNQHMFIINLYK